jgi:hypothetical protein
MEHLRVDKAEPPQSMAAGVAVVGLPGFEPHRPIPGSLSASTTVRLACTFTIAVCWDVHAYAHRL